MPLTEQLDARIHVGDVGTEFVVAVTDEDGSAVNISAAAPMLIFLTKPDGTVLAKTAVLDTTGTNGLMKYVTVAGDLSAPGRWKIQGRVTLGGSRWSTREAAFTVFAAP